MSHMEDDDPPIKSHPASKEYRENFDRIFGAEEKPDTAENADTSTKVEDSPRESGLLHECRHQGRVVRNCPYDADINDNSEARCKCCDQCADDCAMEI